MQLTYIDRAASEGEMWDSVYIESKVIRKEQISEKERKVVQYVL